MTPSEVRLQPTGRIVEMLVGLRPSDEAVAWLAAVIASPSAVAGMGELSRRFEAGDGQLARAGRARHAGSVLIDGAKFKHFFWSRRIPLSQVGPMVGRSGGLASVLARKGCMSYWTADDIATELGMHVDAFISAVGTAEELERLAV